MASRYYGNSKGVTLVTESSSTTSKQLELIVDLAKSMVKSEVLLYLDLIKQKILSGNFPITTAALLYRAYYMNRGQTQHAVASGVPTYATGTLTCASVIATDTVTIDGTTLTAHASTQNTTTFAIGVSDTACAANLATCINANPTISAKMTATSALGVVTLTPVLPGTAANSFTLSSVGGTITRSAATLAGGAEVTSGDVRLKLLMSGGFSKGDFAVGVQRIRDHIVKGNWPPA